MTTRQRELAQTI